MSNDIYRKSSKPVVLPKGWPYEDVKPAKNIPKYEPYARETDTVIEGYTKRSIRMEDLSKIGRTLFAIVVVVLIIASFIFMDVRDEAAQEDCRRSGGEVELIHNARPYGLEQPWVCTRAR